MTINRMHALFWSGTGNSYLAARWMTERAGEFGIPVELHAMPNTDPRKMKLSKGTLLVISGPVLGFNNPWKMVKFLIRIPKKAAEEAVCITTRGALRVSKKTIPGCAALAYYLPSILLRCKNIRIRGIFSVNMPSNWFFAHPAQSDENHMRIIRKAEKKVRNFTDAIIQGRYRWWTPNSIYETIGAILLLPLSALFFFFGRYNHAKLFFANKNCNGCGRCADFCPSGAIRMKGKPPRPFWTFRCEACMRCGGVCPRNAVEAGHSWAALLCWITTLSVLNILAIRFLFNHWTLPHILKDFMSVLWFYLSIPIAYRIFWLLMQIPPINWLFSNTTLTHLPGWKRYLAPGVKPEDLEGKGRKI